MDREARRKAGRANRAIVALIRGVLKVQRSGWNSFTESLLKLDEWMALLLSPVAG